MATAATTLQDGQVGSPTIPLSAIRENPAALRGVDKSNPEYVQLVESVKIKGVLNPVVVRRLVDPETKEVFYGLVDGLHRYNAAQDAGLDSIPVHVVEGDDLEVLEAQIITNAHRVQTKPVEFTKGIQRLMSANPLMTSTELAGKLGMSTDWINDRLGLLKLAPPIQKLVDEGTIGLSNAYALAKLKDPQEQSNFVDRAITQTPQEFVPAVQARVKEINEARRAGRAAAPEGFQAQPKLQKLGDIKTEYESGAIGQFLKQQNAPHANHDWLAGFRMAIAWALSMDPQSQQAHEQAWNQRQEKKKLDKETRDKEKNEKKLADAQAKAKEAQDALDAARQPAGASA